MARMATKSARIPQKPAAKAAAETPREPVGTHSEALLNSTILADQPVPVATTLSEEQLAIATEVQNGQGNILVRARAGTGKTYLLRRCVPLMRGKIAIAAYNRKIAREIKAKLVEDGVLTREWADVMADRDGVDVGTFHAYGYRVLRASLKGVRVEGGGKDGAGFYKFDVICERLNIAKPIQTLVRKAMERAQERLLEIPQKQDTETLLANAHAAQHAVVVNFLRGLVAFEKPQWRAQMESIANWYERNGYLTERQVMSARMGAKNAGQRMPKELIVGAENRVAPPPTKEQAEPVKDGLDPRWFDLARHYALQLELPSDDSIEMQILANSMPGADTDEVREAMLRKCLELAAKAIHESAKMAHETFNAKRFVKGRGWVDGEQFTGVISYNEMLYLPIYLNLPIPQYNWVLVDEGQDSNDARREFARRMMKGRAMFVADDRQAIYGWAGADNDAVDKIINEFDCKVFPMTVTFRCGKAIVELAKRIVPDYRAADTNPEGEVEEIDEKTFAEMELLPTDAIICRNTAPLVKTAYKLIARGVACHVEGKDIGKRLLPLLYRWPSIKNVAPFLDRLVEYRDTETAKFMAQKMESAAEELSDRVETIQAIVEFLPKDSKVADIQAHVEKLFSDTDENDEAPKNLTLITAHRSKGLEYNRVFGFGVRKFMPSPYAKQDWQRVQEENLEYVLKTRAIQTYIDVVVV